MSHCRASGTTRAHADAFSDMYPISGTENSSAVEANGAEVGGRRALRRGSVAAPASEDGADALGRLDRDSVRSAESTMLSSRCLGRAVDRAESRRHLLLPPSAPSSR
ncbi:MAG TPA: hypothetical protein DCQ98_03395 [Planctomycetaceae bacterium]|nr:hypothetical protein [Planctomycetaceae bacterium]